MENHYFKTAEFAALCGVRKDTLLHYDHIGCLLYTSDAADE